MSWMFGRTLQDVYEGKNLRDIIDNNLIIAASQKSMSSMSLDHIALVCKLSKGPKTGLGSSRGPQG